MPLSIIPADTVLLVAIKDATKSTSTVNPARITTAVQKMRPDWAVNKRRVKRLLRSMHNDAWKTAKPIGRKVSSDGAKSSEVSTSPKGGPELRNVEPPKKADDSSQVCDTAPASPGSPASTDVQGGRTSGAGEVTGSDPPTRSSPSPDTALSPATEHGVPWKNVHNEKDEQLAEPDGTDIVADELRDSLRLEPDLDIEPGIDLKSELGLESTVLVGSSVAVDVNIVDIQEIEVIGQINGDVVSMNQSNSSREKEIHDDKLKGGARRDDWGFEIIEKAEAVGASASTSRSNAGTVAEGGVKSRKAWPWAWGRS